MRPFAVRAIERRALEEHEARILNTRGKDLMTTPELIEDGRSTLGREIVRESILRTHATFPSWSPEQIAAEVECSPVTVRKVIRVAESSRSRVTR
jgi:hypothetical protein